MKIEKRILLAPFTTFGVGGKARYFCRATSLDDLSKAILFVRKENIPFLVLGDGSNILVSDKGFAGIVIKIDILGVDFKEWKAGVEIVAGAGESWDEIANLCVKKRLYGAENLSGIPGTMGGAVVQNIGAYGAECSGILKWAEVFDTKTMKVRILSKRACKLGYRDSIFRRNNGRYIITRASILLSKKGRSNISYRDLKEYFSKQNKERPSIVEVRQAVLEIRSRKFPDLEYVGNAGSFFKNPIVSQAQHEKLLRHYPGLVGYKTGNGKIKLSLAWIIEHVCKMKNYRTGDAGVAPNQTLVLCNFGNATASEIYALAREIENAVLASTGVKIEPEVCFVPSGDVKQ